MREARTMSQAELGDYMAALGFAWSANTVALIERGKRRLKVAELFSVAFCLDATLQEVFTQDDSQDTEELRSDQWRFIGSWLRYNVTLKRAVESQQVPQAIDIGGIRFDTYDQARIFLASKGEEQKLKRERRNLELLFARNLSKLTERDITFEQVQAISLAAYGHDVFTERNQRIADVAAKRGDSPFLTQLLGHITRQMTEELVDPACGSGAFLEAASGVDAAVTEPKGAANEFQI